MANLCRIDEKASFVVKNAPKIGLMNRITCVNDKPIVIIQILSKTI